MKIKITFNSRSIKFLFTPSYNIDAHDNLLISFSYGALGSSFFSIYKAMKEINNPISEKLIIIFVAVLLFTFTAVGSILLLIQRLIS